jgi:hypothetical protein
LQAVSLWEINLPAFPPYCHAVSVLPSTQAAFQLLRYRNKNMHTLPL